MIRESVKRTLEFFQLCFPEKDIIFEIQCGYFGEWVERFEGGSPELYMDSINKTLWDNKNGKK